MKISKVSPERDFDSAAVKFQANTEKNEISFAFLAFGLTFEFIYSFNRAMAENFRSLRLETIFSTFFFFSARKISDSEVSELFVVDARRSMQPRGGRVGAQKISLLNRNLVRIHCQVYFSSTQREIPPFVISFQIQSQTARRVTCARIGESSNSKKLHR